VNVAMIGLGWWGKKMTAVLQKAGDDIRIVCAAEPNPAGAEFAKQTALRTTPPCVRRSPTPVLRQ
jgi:predicted dehydrogenase